MFIRIKNAQTAGHASVLIPHSRLKQEIAKTLERAHVVGVAERKGKRVRKVLEITLLYKDGTPLVTDVHLISKPSRRLYASCKELASSRHGGVIVLSTPKGVMTSTEARAAKTGGQLIAEVW
ncbi:MAG: 30S ribosomal protein S8 [Candidatus Sungbacteria bacterium]|nr:30S ribosomal protein S8 [Candidatus Sungbacteria bacterium]